MRRLTRNQVLIQRMTIYSNSVHRVPIRSKIVLLGTKIVSSKTRDVSDTIPKALLRGTSRPPLVVKTEVQIEYAHSIPVQIIGRGSFFEK